jgi:deoxyribose-phosphate aldolase
MQPEELQRLIQIVVEEIGALRAPARCPCHGWPLERCPRRQRAPEFAASSGFALRDSAGPPALDFAAVIDHTLLKPDATRQQIETLCREARQYGFATVCVNPTWVATCARALEGSGVKVCSVVGFPLGAAATGTKQYEAHRALFDGARELDMVMNVGALKSDDLVLVARDIEAVVATGREAGALVKVIIEAALLTVEEKVAACTVAKAAGADFVKTSTGFGPGGAIVADVALMRRVVGSGMGVKAAGGIRDLASVEQMLAAGATRIGTSSGVQIAHEARGGRTSAGESAY